MELDPECQRCRLCGTRTRVVPPDGDRSSSICLVGEAPGRQEDLEGRPFVGRSGRLLDRIMEEEGLSRGEVMITNAVKCRPPDNRAPRRDEIAACFPHLEQELKGKEVVVLLGRSACRSVLGRDVKMADEANTVIVWSMNGDELEVIPTYHPSAALRNRAAREGLRETIRSLRRRA